MRAKETVVLFDPGIRSLNIGDSIIMQSAERELSWLTEGRYVIKCATHSPAVTFYQNTRKNPRMRVYDEAKYKFVCGSNLLWKRMMIPRPTWNINPFNSMPYEGCVLFGVGSDSGSKGLDGYTRRLYRRILSSQYAHSVRDEKTKGIVESLGLRAINTGCPTMWGFTDEFCDSIPTAKSDSVVFTITDYNRDLERDRTMVETLRRCYDHVTFWPQGAFDCEYIEAFMPDGVEWLSPSLESFDRCLSEGAIDYVGTRLHAGMFAMQHRRRSIILTVDNRVRSMKQTYGINCVERSDVESLEGMIKSDLPTRMNLDLAAIASWKSQF